MFEFSKDEPIPPPNPLRQQIRGGGPRQTAGKMCVLMAQDNQGDTAGAVHIAEKKGLITIGRIGSGAQGHPVFVAYTRTKLEHPASALNG